MIKIIILNSLRNEIYKKFKSDSSKIYSLIRELERNPNKGKVLGHVGSISIRELKYESFRFYYILNGFELSLYNDKKLSELLIKIIEMSKKNNQDEIIEKIKYMLSKMRFDKI